MLYSSFIIVRKFKFCVSPLVKRSLFIDSMNGVVGSVIVKKFKDLISF